MIDPRPTDANPDSPPRDDDRGSIEQVDSETRDDPRSGIEQAVEARSDAVARGEGGTAAPDDPSASVGGAGGEVKNQHDDAQ